MTRPLIAAVQLPEDAARSWFDGLDGVEVRLTGPNLSGLDADVECLVLVPESHGGRLIPPASWPGSVRWVQLLSTGTDGYPDWIFGGVAVTTMHGVNATAVAELAMAAILAAARRIPEIWAESDTWQKRGGTDLSGATMGIVGFGAIGAAVARRAAAFDMDIQAVRASDTPLPAPVRRATSIEDLFATSDHIVLALPASPATNRLVDAALLDQAKSGLHLVNVARGDLVDEAALLSALDSGQVSLATLDVLAQEPPPADHPLLHHPRARVSAHVAANTPGSIGGIAQRVRRNFEAFSSGGPLEGLLTNRTGSNP